MLTTKPVPFWSNIRSGLAGADSGAAAAAVGLAAGNAEKSPAAPRPDCLILATQCASTGSNWSVRSRLN